VIKILIRGCDSALEQFQLAEMRSSRRLDWNSLI
jgi:hypothetical protein